MNPRSFLLSCFILFITLNSCIKKNIPPVITDQTFLIDENSVEGLFVGQVLANDEDGQITSFSILSGNTNDAFSISGSDGKISVNNKQALDYETTPVFLLTIEVKDNRNKGSIAKAVISLINVDESPRIVSLLTDQLRYGNVLTIYGKYFNKLAGATFVCLKGSSQIYTLTPLSVTTDSIKVEIYNQQNPAQLFDLNYLQVGLKTDNLIKWSDYYITLLSSWRKLNDFPGTGRYKSASFSIDGKIYIGCGAGQGYVFNDLWRYDPVAATWSRMADLPGISRSYPRAFSNATNGFLGAGFSADNTSKIQLYDFYKYNPQNDSWSSIQNYPDLISNFYVGFSVNVNNRSFISLSNQELIMREFVNDTWQAIPTIPEMIDCPASGVFSIGTKFYVIVGYKINNTYSNSVWEFNTIDNGWTRKADFPGTARFAPAFFQVANYGYYGCGMSTNQQQFKDMWRYDPLSDSWIRIEDFPGGIRSHLVSSYDGKSGFVGLGLIMSVVSYQKDFWRFDPK